MTFFSGNSDMDTLIDLIADQLIATGAWGTADAALATGQHPAKRAIKHLTDANLNVYFTRQVLSVPGSTRWNEILIQISTGFDTVGHAPNGTIQTTGICCEGWQKYNSGAQYYYGNDVGSGNKAVTHYTWIDAAGVTLQVTGATSPAKDFTVFFNLERNTTKEYADGFSNVFCAAIPNDDVGFYDQTYTQSYYSNAVGAGQGSPNGAGRANICRPFNYQQYAGYAGGLATFFGSYRSLGNSKVYFEFPFFSNNQVVAQPQPIAQTGRFFLINPGQGMADGDLVTYVSGANTYTFLVKLLQSPDSIAYSPWAIRQA
ncbi:MAG: hypothetical protein ACYDBQ_03535 [Thermoplasmatota archaeon]